MNPPLLRLTACALLSLGLTLSAQAEIYKWTDADGNVHYSQTPPQDKNTKAEDIADEIGLAAGSSGSSQTTPPENTKSADEVEAARQAGEQNKVKHRDFCEQQNAALKQLLANPVIRWQGEDGEKILTAEEREQKIAEFEGNIEKLCNPEVMSAQNKVAAE